MQSERVSVSNTYLRVQVADCIANLAKADDETREVEPPHQARPAPGTNEAGRRTRQLHPLDGVEGRSPLAVLHEDQVLDGRLGARPQAVVTGRRRLLSHRLRRRRHGAALVPSPETVVVYRDNAGVNQLLEQPGLLDRHLPLGRGVHARNLEHHRRRTARRTATAGPAGLLACPASGRGGADSRGGGVPRAADVVLVDRRAAAARRLDQVDEGEAALAELFAY